MRKTLRGFTLIELLIVVAIIAILAAIAVPNFLEAQVRSKVSRMKADMRSEATALEAYCVDTNTFPLCNAFTVAVAAGSGPPESDIKILENLSTPVAYMSSAITRDVFTLTGRFGQANGAAVAAGTPTPLVATDPAFIYNCLLYASWNDNQRARVITGSFEPKIVKASAWVLHSGGPAGNYYNLGGLLANDKATDVNYDIDLIYDPSNGTVSRGSIWRTGGSASPGPNPAEPGGIYYAGAGVVAAIRSQK